jgi:hypothetical protein
MYPHSLLWHYLWIAPHALQAIIAIVMIRRRLFREFPMFLAYTIFEFVQGGTLFILDHSAKISAYQYWEAYWLVQGVSIVLRFAIIYEIFSHVFRPYPALRELSQIMFRWATVVLVLVAVAVAAYAPGDGAHLIISGVKIVDRTVGVVQSGLLVFLFLCASYFRLSWRSYVFGIAVGMGIFASVDLATSAIQAASEIADGSHAFNFLSMAVYHCCVVIWLVYMLAPESVGRTVKDVPDHNLEEWNAALQRLLMQ